MKRPNARYPYQEVAADLLRRIHEGQWRAGEQLPPLAVLEREYPQSRMTLYKAMRSLRARGVVTMTRGRGTFVRQTQVRERIAILTGAALFQQPSTPFSVHAFRHAHAHLARLNLDAQLYVEDPLGDTGMPTGLGQELENRRLAGLLTIDAQFPARYLPTPEWRRYAIPYVNLGAISAPHTVYVDRRAFVTGAVAFAAGQGRSRLALIERAEHLTEHLETFRAACDQHGLEALPPPARMPSPGLCYEAYGYDLMHRVWAADTARPDAVIVPDDVIAKGVSEAVLALRVAVPAQLQLIAMVNRGANAFYPVPLVCFEVDVEALVARAAQMLVALINGVAVPPRVLLIPPLPPASVAAALPR